MIVKPAYTIEVYKSPKNKQWYWRIRSRNGKIICNSEGYMKRANAMQVIQKMTLNIVNAYIKIIEA